MRAIVKGKNAEIPERVRSYADRKLSRVERLLDERSDAVLELWREAHRSVDDQHFAEVSLWINGEPVRTVATGRSYQAAIDEVVDKLERRAVGHKERPRIRERSMEEKTLLAHIADGTAEGRPERKVVKTKRFGIEPMFEEDAIARMDELGHEFFVFVNAENEHVNVLYRRRDGNLGLIEPVLGGSYAPEAEPHAMR